MGVWTQQWRWADSAYHCDSAFIGTDIVNPVKILPVAHETLSFIDEMSISARWWRGSKDRREQTVDRTPEASP
jgi:hypothetical protein